MTVSVVSVEPCIRSNNEWYTPIEFEKLAGKVSSRNWRQSIHFQGPPLKELLEVFKRKAKP